jgi:two-component system response regulator FlrC
MPPVVLIVDDEPLNRDLLRRLLFREYHVLEAADAEAALAVLAAAPVDLVLCDHVMPGRSGADLAREVRARYPHTPLLLLTGYEDAPEIARAFRDGVVAGVVAKPWSTVELKTALERAMGRG